MRTSRSDCARRVPRARTATLDLFRHDMRKLTVYGLPLNPLSALEQLAGASFCVSYGTRDKLNGQVDDAIRLVGEDQILLVDNSAFGMHKQGDDTRDEAYLEDYERWAQAILDRCPQAIAVIPDIIEGAESDNAELIRRRCWTTSARCRSGAARKHRLPASPLRKPVQLRRLRIERRVLEGRNPASGRAGSTRRSPQSTAGSGRAKAPTSGRGST